jgi:outer membrane receptor for ferrienterochelin and colicins
VASATTRGFEAAAEIELGDRISAHGSYTFTDGRDNTLDRALEGRSKHRGTGRLSLDHNAWGLNGFLRAGFVGRRAYYMDTDADDVEETVHSDPYITLDARVSKSIARIGELFMGADNLLNAGDVMFLTLPPRFFYAGFSARFSSSNGTDSSDGLGLHRSRSSPFLPTAFESY